MRFFRPCLISGWLYPGAVFRMKTEEKLLCLTFDDGPDPDSTPQILEILDKFNIRGIFFCDGKAAEKYVDLVNLITEKGHVIGNHGYAHPDGWKTRSDKYIEDVSKGSAYTSTTLFRPPYGHMKFKQYRILKKKYKVIFWDLMPYDFDLNFGTEKSLYILRKKLRPGSIIVLHDTSSSPANLILTGFIEYALKKNYKFVITPLG